MRVKGAALARTARRELGVVVSAWLKCFSPSWQAQGINPAALNAALAKMQAVVPRNLPPDVGALALELASNIGTRQATLGPRGAGVGEPPPRCWPSETRTARSTPSRPRPPPSARTRSARPPATRRTAVAPGWRRPREARDLIAFGVAEAFAEARSRLGLERA